MIQNFNVRKTSLKSLKPSRSSYLQYALSAAKKKTKVCFESTSLRKGLRDSLSFFSSSLLLPEKSLQIQAHARQAETRAGPCLQARQLQTCLKHKLQSSNASRLWVENAPFGVARAANGRNLLHTTFQNKINSIFLRKLLERMYICVDSQASRSE